MDWITTSGRTLHEAKSNALDQLGIVADDAEFDIINDVEKGLFGRVKVEAKIRARVRPKQPATKDDRGGNRRRSGGGNRNRKGNDKNRSGKKNDASSANRSANGGSSNKPKRSADGASKSDGGNRQRNKPQEDAAGGNAQPAAQSKPKQAKQKKETVEHEISREEQEQTATEFLDGILTAFSMTGDVSVVQEPADDGAIEMSVTGAELGLLVGQKGINLNALQELTRTVVQRKADGAKTDRLRVDVAGYRARRMQALQEFTRGIAAEVLESGTERLLEPMGPADRKVVHDEINGIDGVETGSEGEEPRRRVVIRPS